MLIDSMSTSRLALISLVLLLSAVLILLQDPPHPMQYAAVAAIGIGAIGAVSEQLGGTTGKSRLAVQLLVLMAWVVWWPMAVYLKSPVAAVTFPLLAVLGTVHEWLLQHREKQLNPEEPPQPPPQHLPPAPPPPPNLPPS